MQEGRLYRAPHRAAQNSCCLSAVLPLTGRRAYAKGCLQTGNQVLKGFHEIRVVLQLVWVGRGGDGIRDLHNM